MNFSAMAAAVSVTVAILLWGLSLALPVDEDGGKCVDLFEQASQARATASRNGIPMALPVIASKLFTPALKDGVVPRSRLARLLRQGAASKLTLLSAPAGFGKTTLLAAWLNEPSVDDHHVAWLSLDPSDSDPPAFWTSVMATLNPAIPCLDSGLLEQLASSPASAERMLTTLLNALAAVTHEVWLMLDDYHLANGREIGKGMAFLVEHLPPQVHITISTRADPDLPLSRWRARGELLEIRAADLRFTPDETTEYFNALPGLALGTEEAAVLFQRTEGWIAALQLAGLSLQNRTDVAGFIARFGGDDRYVLDYLLEEVLAQQPEPIRHFLFHTAILDRLTGPLCDALTCEAGGSGMLAALERANLFLVPLDDRREWYRYHHLFADVLRVRLTSEQPEQVPLLHQRASRWFEGMGMEADAIRHALAATDFDRAAHLMELAATRIRRNRQDAVFLGWLKELPENVIRRSPVLLVFQSFGLMALGRLDDVEPLLQQAERAMASGPGPDGAHPPWAGVEEFRTLPATIEIYRTSLAQSRGDDTGTVRHAQRALALAGPNDHLTLGAASGFLGLAAWARGDVSTALQSFTQAVASLHAAGNLIDELGSTAVLADLWLVAGRPGKARQLLLHALNTALAQGVSAERATAELHVALGELDCEAGDHAGARQHLEAATALQEHAPLNESRYRWFVASAMLARAEGKPEQALDLLERAEPLYRRGFFPDVRPIPALKARIWISRGRLLDAGDWAREQGITATDRATYSNEFNHLTLVRLLIAQHRAQPASGAAGQAQALLEPLLDAAKAAGRAGSLMEIRMLLALAHEAQGHRSAAREELARAFAETPEPEAQVLLFRNEGFPLAGLLEAGHTPKSHAPPSSIGMLNERERQVLRLLGGGLSGPQIAGELFISYNTLRTHTKHIFTKLEVADRRAAVRRARELGLI